MFAKLDNYLTVIKDSEQSIEDRIKNHRQATRRMEKIRTQIEEIGDNITNYKPQPATEKVKDWESEIETLQNEIDSVSTLPPEKLVESYQKTIDRLAGLMLELENQEVKIKEVVEDDDQLKPLELDGILDTNKLAQQLDSSSESSTESVSD